MTPLPTNAAVFEEFKSLFQTRVEAASTNAPTKTVQTMWLPKPALNFDPNPAKGGGGITIVDDAALVPEEGPSGTIADIEKPRSSGIAIYVVQQGDTLTRIAEMFDVSVNTIKWANNIAPSGAIRVGQTLTILPVTGVKYTTKQGDTLSSVAKKFGGDSEEIASFNGIDGVFAAGTEIIIPDGEIAAPPAAKAVKLTVSSSGSVSYAGYYLRPIVGGKRTQGVHGYNGVDLAAPVGTPILAAASGDVIVSKQGGWNGGYGSYIVIKHDNGTQSLYAHNSSNAAFVGQRVVQGQVIGYVGSTGKSTGPHVHFEIRGGPRNPF